MSRSRPPRHRQYSGGPADRHREPRAEGQREELTAPGLNSQARDARRACGGGQIGEGTPPPHTTMPGQKARLMRRPSSSHFRRPDLMVQSSSSWHLVPLTSARTFLARLCSCSILRAHPEERATRALGLLEAGRAVLLSPAMDAQNDLEGLTRVHPHMARKLLEFHENLSRTFTAVVVR